MSAKLQSVVSNLESEKDIYDQPTPKIEEDPAPVEHHAERPIAKEVQAPQHHKKGHAHKKNMKMQKVNMVG